MVCIKNIGVYIENKQYFIYLTPENIGLTLKIQIYGKI